MAETNKIQDYPNLIIVAGTGRNVGKTLTACKIIEHLASSSEVTAVKISPHFHPLEGNYHYVYQSPSLMVARELNISSKDSSRMLQSGAKQAYYIQSGPENLMKGMDMILAGADGKPVVAESGGLYHFAEPGLLVYVRGETIKQEMHVRSSTRKVILETHQTGEFHWKDLHFTNGKYTIDD